jgi:hypothetical protein
MPHTEQSQYKACCSPRERSDSRRKSKVATGHRDCGAEQRCGDSPGRSNLNRQPPGRLECDKTLVLRYVRVLDAQSLETP